MRILMLGPPDSRGALAAARALGQSGHEVGFASVARGSLVAASRWVRRWHRVAWPQHPAFGRTLLCAVRDRDYELVFAAGDDWLTALSHHRRTIPARVPYSADEALAASMDKLTLARLTLQAGLRAPRTVPATAAAITSWEGPAVVKARRHWLASASAVSLRLEAEVAHDREHAARRAEKIRASGSEPILQEVLDGHLVAITTLTGRHARPVARLQQRAERLWPVPAGVSTRATTVPVDEHLADGLDRLLAGLDWFGLAQAQFIVSGHDAVLIDLNARFYGSMALAAAAGVNLPDLWVRLAAGDNDAVPQTPSIGTRYSWLEGDLRRASYVRQGGLVRDVGGSLAWAFGASHSILDPRDPVPAVRYSAHLARRAAAKWGRGTSR